MNTTNRPRGNSRVLTVPTVNALPLAASTLALLATVSAGIGGGCGTPGVDPFVASADDDAGTDATARGTRAPDGPAPPTGGFGEPGTPGTPGAGAQDSGNLYSDATPEAGVGTCSAGDAGAPPFPQRCVPLTANECDSTTDLALGTFGVGAGLQNGTGGNGFDDDCDGQVDEGCRCASNGSTRDCYLVPATQVDPATQKPVGWCAQNSKGSLDCAGAEFPRWSGTCRGGQPPFRHDVCAPGDFNCDGLPLNSDVTDCSCKVDPVSCPTAPLVLTPYPAANAIPRIDGSSWISDPAQRANATNWAWTVVGGDCDNVLPFPTFALYNQSAASPASRIAAARTPVVFDANLTPARYTPRAAEPLVSLSASGRSDLYTAFALSGDYLVQGEFDLAGTHYVCTQKVEVRAPGVRAELCWDTVGGMNSDGNDIDLHVARLQGLTCPNPGWDDECPTGGTYADCWYLPSSGCRDSSPVAPGWGYSNSQDSACLGWGSRRTANRQRCTNPRLDQDNIRCDRSVADPSAPTFCGPENINLDNPNDGDRFVVGVTHFGNNRGTNNAKPHVNVYCNGKRVLSAGYNPLTGQTQVPLLNTPGSNSSGDFWNVARVRTNVVGGQLVSCDVEPVPSHVADATRDGQPSSGSTGNGLCVDSHTSSTSPPNKFEYSNQRWQENAALQQSTRGLPNAATDWCKH